MDMFAIATESFSMPQIGSWDNLCVPRCGFGLILIWSCTVWTEESVKHAAAEGQGRRALHHFPASNDYCYVWRMPSIRTQGPLRIMNETCDEYRYRRFGMGDSGKHVLQWVCRSNLVPGYCKCCNREESIQRIATSVPFCQILLLLSGAWHATSWLKQCIIEKNLDSESGIPENIDKVFLNSQQLKVFWIDGVGVHSEGQKYPICANI